MYSILIDSDISANDLRQLVAGVITSQPEQYTAAILGKPNQDYVEWILKDESWGGKYICVSVHYGLYVQYVVMFWSYKLYFNIGVYIL